MENADKGERGRSDGFDVMQNKKISASLAGESLRIFVNRCENQSWRRMSHWWLWGRMMDAGIRNLSVFAGCPRPGWRGSTRVRHNRIYMHADPSKCIKVKFWGKVPPVSRASLSFDSLFFKALMVFFLQPSVKPPWWQVAVVGWRFGQIGICFKPEFYLSGRPLNPALVSQATLSHCQGGGEVGWVGNNCCS